MSVTSSDCKYSIKSCKSGSCAYVFLSKTNLNTCVTNTNNAIDFVSKGLCQFCAGQKYETETFLLISSSDRSNELLSLSTVEVNKANKNSVKSFVELHNQTRLNPQPHRDLSGACDWLLLGYVFSYANDNQSRDALRIPAQRRNQCGSSRVEPKNLIRYLNGLRRQLWVPFALAKTKGISQSLDWEVEMMSGKRQQQKVTKMITNCRNKEMFKIDKTSVFMSLKHSFLHFRSELTCIQISLSLAIVFVISQPAITRKDPALVMNNDYYLFQVPPCP